MDSPEKERIPENLTVCSKISGRYRCVYLCCGYYTTAEIYSDFRILGDSWGFKGMNTMMMAPFGLKPGDQKLSYCLAVSRCFKYFSFSILSWIFLDDNPPLDASS